MGASRAATPLSLPKGGGALTGIGEKFSPDLHSGTGNFSLPIALPAGRLGLQPELRLLYSSGTGNGPFGLGWSLALPGISRKTSHGIPRYVDDRDDFILSGYEDLVALGREGATTRYRPRTEGLFADIRRVVDETSDYWVVRSKEGLTSTYGTPGARGADPATLADPDARTNVFAWRLTRTEDSFGNRIEYAYEHDRAEEGPHRWDQLYLSRIRYVDHGPDRAHPEFLVSVELSYEPRPDAFSDSRAGFEVRTRRRCTRIAVQTHAGTARLLRTYDLRYLDALPGMRAAPNGVSLLSRLAVTGYDGAVAEHLPPVELRYTAFEPARRTFFPVTGSDLPAGSLADAGVALVDVFGSGLPDVIELGGTARVWRNLGDGRFDLPRTMPAAPGGVTLGEAGVQLLDADGDGRTDLLVTRGALAGYFPLSRDGGWDEGSFRRYRQAPAFALTDPEVRLVDLDGDGVTDAVRSGARFECFFNDPDRGWWETRAIDRQAPERFPNVAFSDPRVHWADMTGDGLQDVVLLSDGNIEYWPNRGYGRWGKRTRMEGSPHLPYGCDPRRLLLGDVDGDGLADLVLVEDTQVRVWINRSGNGWSEPVIIRGTPPVADPDGVRLVDLLGSGIAGLLWTRRADGVSRERHFFLDFTGSVKPYLLHEIDNNIGARTTIEYAPSTRFYLEDQRRRDRRWRTAAPFPIHVVSRVRVADHFSGGTLTTKFRYHHAYWDGAEREYRGFGMVEQLDAESFADDGAPGSHTPPTLTRTWFHQGPVGDEHGDWRELDWSAEYWGEDPPLLGHTERVDRYLARWPTSPDGRRIKRDALRALRGSVLRTELYALDGTPRADRPYTVSESAYDLVEIEAPTDATDRRRRVFFPHLVAQRTTQWERGRDPMTSFSFTRYRDHGEAPIDSFGRPRAQLAIACPRGWRALDDRPGEPYLATLVSTTWAVPTDAGVYIHTRAASTTTFELRNTGGRTIHEVAASTPESTGATLIGHTRLHYDGPAFLGLPLGALGHHGALTRHEELVLTEDVLQQAYGPERPPYLGPAGATAWTAEYPAEFQALLAERAGYRYHAGGAGPTDPGGWLVLAERRRLDVHDDPDGRGLVRETLAPLHDAARDPTAHRVRLDYDPFELLPIAVTDGAGLTTTATHDYRVLQPGEVTDPNGNVTRFRYSPLGLLAESWARGKSPGEGDASRPSVRHEYGLLAFASSPAAARQPIFVRTTRHVHHDTALSVPPAARADTVTTIEYSDGFGRLLQTRTGDDDVRFGDAVFGGGAGVLPAALADGPGGDVIGRRNAALDRPNVVVSGWQRYDNKGRPVTRYEPFFAEGWAYDPPTDAQFGVQATLFYDPRGHVIRTRNPDGSEQRVVQGVPGTIATPDVERPDDYEPTPWEAYSYDANDNAGRTHPAASAGWRHHWNTPSSILVDALGRTVERVERNREPPASPAAPPPPIATLRTRIAYDIRGNVLGVTDALGRAAFRSQYDLGNRTLCTESIDGGRRRMVLDAAGSAVEMRRGSGSLVLSGYDALHRVARVWASDRAGEALTLRERLEYGDAGSAAQPVGDRAAARAANALGRLARVLDEAGELRSTAYDFKGNLLEKTRRTISDDAVLAVLAGPPPSWEAPAYRVDWTDPATTPLEPDAYTTTVAYDALNRPTRLTHPTNVDGVRRDSVPTYARSGALAGVALDGATFVERIAHDAKGQRVLLVRGNGVMTRYAYDPRTFRLLRLRTERFVAPASLTYRRTGVVLQDLTFEYDLVGNVLAIHDRTPGSGVPGTPLGPDALDRTFTYDGLYRLRRATGRECASTPATPWDPAPRCADATLTRAWTETYECDAAGNLTRLWHAAGASALVSDFVLAPSGNRLSTLTRGADVFAYEYDANGNLTRETTSRHLEWDHRDQLRVYRTQTAGAEPTVHAHYLYDGSGHRVKKVVRKAGGHVEVTIDVDGVFERERIVVAGTARATDTLHVLDDRDRIAVRRIGAPFPGDATPAVKHHVGDHLGSGTLVLDDTGALVSREEYLPYGATSFGSFARKRYRFGGHERDEESGLDHAGARYYAPWLGRWTSCDPAGTVDGLNAYQFVRANPVRYADRSGLSAEEQASKDTAALAAKLNASDERVTNVADRFTRHVKDYQDAWERAHVPQSNEADYQKVEQAWKEVDTAKARLQRDEVELNAAIAERRALQAEAKALEARVLKNMQDAWDRTQAQYAQAAQQTQKAPLFRGGGQQGPLVGQTTPRPTQVPMMHQARMARESLQNAQQAETALAAGVRNVTRAAEAGGSLRNVVKVLSEAESADAAAAAGRSGRLGRALKIGGTLLFLGDLATSGANEAGVWDVFSAPLREGYEMYQTAKQAARSWFTIGARMNLEVDRGTRP